MASTTSSNWWLGKKVPVAPLWASRISWDERKAYLDLSRQAIKNSPAWDATAFIDREYDTRPYDYYGRSVCWADGHHPQEARPSQHSATIAARRYFGHQTDTSVGSRTDTGDAELSRTLSAGRQRRTYKALTERKD
jgi:hypothetical protein